MHMITTNCALCWKANIWRVPMQGWWRSGQAAYFAPGTFEDLLSSCCRDTARIQSGSSCPGSLTLTIATVSGGWLYRRVKQHQKIHSASGGNWSRHQPDEVSGGESRDRSHGKHQRSSERTAVRTRFASGCG